MLGQCDHRFYAQFMLHKCGNNFRSISSGILKSHIIVLLLVLFQCMQKIQTLVTEDIIGIWTISKVNVACKSNPCLCTPDHAKTMGTTSAVENVLRSTSTARFGMGSCVFPTRNRFEVFSFPDVHQEAGDSGSLGGGFSIYQSYRSQIWCHSS